MPPIPPRSTKVYDSKDGNILRGTISYDLSTPETVSWLAFCSGSFLKREGRTILPVNPVRQFSFPPTSTFTDRTVPFDDELGLPNSTTVYIGTDQPVLQYRATESTNIMGWNFPLKFFLAEYRKVNTNAWALDLTAKGRISSIGPAQRLTPSPEILAKAFKR